MRGAGSNGTILRCTGLHPLDPRFCKEILNYRINSLKNLLNSVYEYNLHILNRTDVYDWALNC